MQVTEVSSEGLKKKYKIVVDAARIQSQMEVELRAAGEQVKIPGFRPGFIPMKILHQRYGKSVQGDVLKQVINQATNDFVTEKNFRPTLTPSVNIEAYEDGGDLAFTVDFEVFPDMPEIDFSKIKLERKTFEIADADLEKTLATIAERNPTLVSAGKDAIAVDGNVLTIDFKGMLDGVAFKGGTATNFSLELGSGQFIQGFEQQLIGAKEGDDCKVVVTFPADYPSGDLAGKEAVFEVKVHAVLKKEPAIINDEFVKEKGFTDAAAFRDTVKGQMSKEYEQIVRNHLKKELFDILETKYDVDLPQGMVDMEFRSIWERLLEAKKQGDESLEGKSDDELKVEYTEIAKRRVKLGLLLADVGTRNKIQISREEMTRAIMQQASMYPGQENKVMDFYRKNPERVEDLRGPILEEKAVDFILDKVAFNDKKVSLEELTEEDEDGNDNQTAKPAKSSKKPKEDVKSDADEKTGDSAQKASAKKKANK